MSAHRARNAVLLIAATAVMLAAFAAFFAVSALPAGATAGPPPARWLAKSADLPRMATPLRFQWVSCAGPGGWRCQPGRVRTFTDYRVFARWAPAHPGSTVLYDPEGWDATPQYQYVHMWRYLRLFGKAAAAHHITWIGSPVHGTADMASVDAAAASSGAAAVDIQLQWMTKVPAAYGRAAAAIAAGIRAANPGTLVLAGIATDASGHPVTAAQMVAAYRAVRPHVDGFWLNAAIWASGDGCAVTGCRGVGAAFLAAIG